MFNIDPSEFMLVALVALVVIGPKDLPKAMRVVGYWVGRARGVARQFRQGFDSMVREAELEEMEKKWAAENARIMREHPQPPSQPQEAQPQVEPGAEPVAQSWDDARGSAAGGDRPVAAAADDTIVDPRPADAEQPVTTTAPPMFVDAPHVEPARRDDPARGGEPKRGDGVTS